MSTAEVQGPVRISYSAVTRHRSCPQKWAYQSVLKLERIEADVAPERDFGSWWAALRAAEALERGRSLQSLKWVPETVSATEGHEWPGATVTTAEVLAGSEASWRRINLVDQQVWLDRLGGSLPERLRALFVRWQDQWAEERATERPLAAEMGWERDLGETGYRLVGYVDEVFLDTKRNVVVVRDDKTAKSLATQTVADDMMDSQLQFYAWGASPEVSSWGLGSIQAVAYDRARSVAPKSPVLTLAGSLSKSVTDFDRTTYVEWARGPEGLGVPYPGRKKDGSDAGLYVAEEEVIQRLSSPSAVSAWFQRTLTPLNVNIVRAHLQAALDTARDMTRTKERMETVHEAQRNLSAACRWCDYVALCRAQMVGGRDGAYDLAAMGLRIREEAARRR